MNIQQYVAYIKAGKAINFSRFIDLLPESYRKQKRELFDVELTAPQKWKISCSKETLVELERLVLQPTNRVQAAEMGDSHQARVSSSFLLVYHQALTDNRPDVVYLEQERYLQGFTPKKYVMIVENEENFFQPTFMLKLASKFVRQQIDLINTDIVLGSGSRATTKLAYSWYQQYQKIFCAFDYDTAGLMMYRTLKTNLGNHIHFLQPQNYSQYKPYFKKVPKSQAQLRDCIMIAEQLGFISLAKAVKKHKKFMEQEMFLLEMNDE